MRGLEVPAAVEDRGKEVHGLILDRRSAVEDTDRHAHQDAVQHRIRAALGEQHIRCAVQLIHIRHKLVRPQVDARRYLGFQFLQAVKEPFVRSTNSYHGYRVLDVHKRQHDARHARATVSAGSHHDGKAILRQAVFLAEESRCVCHFHDLLTCHKGHDHQLLAREVMLQGIVESETAVDDELIHADVPPVMDVVVGIIGHDLHMRVDLVAVLRGEERSQEMRVDDDIGLHLLEHLEVLPAGAAIDDAHHKRQGVMDAADMRRSHLDIRVPREHVRPLHFLHVTLLHLLQQRVAMEGVLTDQFDIRIMQCLDGIGDRIRRGDVTKTGLDIGH